MCQQRHDLLRRFRGRTGTGRVTHRDTRCSAVHCFANVASSLWSSHSSAAVENPGPRWSERGSRAQGQQTLRKDNQAPAISESDSVYLDSNPSRSVRRLRSGPFRAWIFRSVARWIKQAGSQKAVHDRDALPALAAPFTALRVGQPRGSHARHCVRYAVSPTGCRAPGDGRAR